MVLIMDEVNNHGEETAVTETSSDVEFVCGDPKVEVRVGEEFQAKIPPLMSASKRAKFLSNPLAFDDPSSSFLVGLPVPIMWIDKHQKEQGNGDDDIDMNQSLRSLKAKRNRSSAKMRGESDNNSVSRKQRLNREAVPAIPSSSWEDSEAASFVLSLYTFGKNFTQVKKFMENKGTGEILFFYYDKFYNSAKYHSWSESRKKRNRKCVCGKKLYSGWRQQQLLSRLIPSIPDETQKQVLVNVSKSFAEGNITLEKYISGVKDLVGLRLLVDAVAIGKGKEDLTVITSVPMKTKPWFTVSSKPSLVPGFGAYSSLTSVDIINQLTGSSRLSKARCNDIFWEAVWPRLLARGWHSEQPEDRGYFTSKDNIVFMVPGVKRFSRGKLVKGDHYFDSVSDILTKVALEPELLEFETGEAPVIIVADNSSDKSDEESSPSDSQRHRYLKSPCSNRGTLQMKLFTVVDTSFAAGGKLCDSRNLNTESPVSETRPRLGEKDSNVLKNSMDSQNVEKSKMMPLDVKNQADDSMQFTIIDTSLKHRKKLSGIRRLRHLPGNHSVKGCVEDDSGIKEETFENAKVPSKRSVKHRFTQRAETNNHSVDSGPLLKRRLLSSCIKREKSLSGESHVVKHLPGDDIKRSVCPESDQLGLYAIQHRNTTCEEMNDEKERYKTELPVDFMNLKPDQLKKTGTGTSSSLVEIQEMPKIEPNGVYPISGVENNCSPEEIRTAHEANGLCSVSNSDKKRTSNDMEQEQAVEHPSISGSNNNLGTSQELGSSEQPGNTDGTRRQSTRKRPLTTRALEALESSFLTTKRMKNTTKPRNRQSSRKKKHSAKACNGAQLLQDNGSADLEYKEEEDERIFAKKASASRPLDQIEDSKPSFLLNEANAKSKSVDRRQDSNPVQAERPKLPPIVLKLKRS